MQGVGLPLEEAMKFWRAEFGPKCMGEAFDKKFAYGVRYNYAKEGKRTDYTPYSCMKIIQTPVPKVRHRLCSAGHDVLNVGSSYLGSAQQRRAPDIMSWEIEQEDGVHFRALGV